MKDMRIAAYQMEILTANKENNIAKIQKILKDYQKENLDLLVLPELFSTGFAYSHFHDLAEELECSATITNLSKISQEFNIGLAGSLLIKIKNNSYHNVGFIISPTKGLVYHYKKIHLWGLEKNHFLSGDNVPPAINYEGLANIGLVICYDLRFPEVYRKLAISGAELLITTAAWPAQRWEHFKLLAAARALENTCYHIAVNRIGEEHDPVTVQYNGSSAIYSPMGAEIVAGKGIDHLLIANLSGEFLQKTRSYLPVLKDRKLEI